MYFSAELVNHPNSSGLTPSSDLSYDFYRFRLLNEQEPIMMRSKNIAKVEPYLVNTNTNRPLSQLSSQPISKTTATMTTTTTTTSAPSKARINLDSMGNTPTNSSTSSSTGSFGGMIYPSHIRYSDFLIPNPAYQTPSSQSLSKFSSHTTFPTLLSESLSHGSLHQLPAANCSSYNEHATDLTSSINNFQQTYPSFTQGNIRSCVVRIINRFYY